MSHFTRTALYLQHVLDSAKMPGSGNSSLNYFL